MAIVEIIIGKVAIVIGINIVMTVMTELVMVIGVK